MLTFIEPKLREGYDDVECAAKNALPPLVTAKHIKRELHAHSTSSDGSDSIDDMAGAARQRDYEYIGISDHSQSLKIARGVSIEDLWDQIRYIDGLSVSDSCAEPEIEMICWLRFHNQGSKSRT